MIASRIPGIEDDFARIRTLAPSGFVLALNLRWIGPEFLHSEYPAEWRKIYEDKNYFMFDPIFYWTLTKTGRSRWSEVGFPDPQKISEKAAKYGLNYGAVFAQKMDGRKSFLAVCRPDREFTEPEMDQIEATFDKWMVVVAERPPLTDGELAVLGALRDGLSQTEAGETLGIATATVKKRLKSARNKFGASTSAEAVSIAVEKRYFHKD